MIRPLSRLPRAWRMTEAEETTVATVEQMYARQRKLRENIERFGRKSEIVVESRAVTDEIESKQQPKAKRKQHPGFGTDGMYP
jgi:hypothetical protein